MDEFTKFMVTIAGLVLIGWLIVGAYVWQRYGFEGVQFCWSKDFPRALYEWRKKQLEGL